MIALLLALTLGASVTTPEGCSMLPEAERAPCAQTVAGGYSFSSSVAVPSLASEVADTSLAGMTGFESAMVREARNQSGSLKVIAAVQAINMGIILILGVLIAAQ